MRIEQLMQKSVGSVTAEQTLNQAAQILWELDCGCVPVVSEDGTRRVVGMLTDRDICMAAYTQGRELRELYVRGAMSSDVQTCRPDDSVEDAEAILRRAQVRRLPVVDEADQLVGIVSLSDLARAAARCRSQKKPEIDEAEVAETLASICRPHEVCAPVAAAV